MLTQDCKVVWYGKIKLDSKKIPVIYDPLITPSIKGCIYLYNAERDAIIQYTWKIVESLLCDVDKTEKAAIKKSLDAKWKAARKRFSKGRVYAFNPEDKAPAPAPVAPSNEQRWDTSDDDSFELEDLG
ncbi:MAG: hypothetical protein R3E64_02435 [Halioglobus sp.]